ncbi:MAG: GntR family transcriptional regulator [Lachnospiraceae bacterium]|nr:GntR family transcriptional regulator [Lachnospiraceae bacterium]
MNIEINPGSNDALYTQVHDQIILGIAKSLLRDGDHLPSVRSLADEIGINMHTVNKAYALLRDEGFLKLDPRQGAVVKVSRDKKVRPKIQTELRILTAQAMLKGISRAEMHDLLDGICDEWS